MGSGRKLFFGLFIFPLLIAVGMAVLLCSVVLLTNEAQTPESLIGAVKSGSPGKRWQKAYELSNELNRKGVHFQKERVLGEIIYILKDPVRYDEKTRGYMAVALAHFKDPEAVEALKISLKDPSDDLKLYALWSLGMIQAKEALPDILPFLKAGREDLREMAVYVLGAIGDKSAAPEMRKLLNDPSVGVRWNAALALARLGDAGGLDILLKMLERGSLESDYRMPGEQIEKVMTNAIRGLALIQRPESIKILESVSRKDKSLKVRQAAFEALEIVRKSDGIAR
ncbi:MAG: HEAT repeat domain-containing protein [Candidatus Omnitrophica bacterium]|nr:HEAT repeat domain-containing protein [Candidatus Omnitrophota bacterium]